MANENIGDIACPFGCAGTAHVRRYNPRKPPKAGEGEQRGKFYIHCAECGPILASSRRVQEYILSTAKFYGAGDRPAASDIPARESPQGPKGSGSSGDKAPAARPATPPAPPAKKVKFDFDPYA